MAKTKTKPVDGDRHAMLRIDLIRTDGDTQPRAGVSDELAAEYAASYEAGIELPPVDVVFDGKDYWLWDGFHRMEAHRQSGAGLVLARVREGTLADAQWLCLSANRGHGLRRTNADKRRAVELALRRKPELSDRAIAEHCGVSHNFVGDMRKHLSSDDRCETPPTRTVTRGGTTYTQDTSNIGKSRPATVSEQSQPAPAPAADSDQADAKQPEQPDQPTPSKPAAPSLDAWGIPIQPHALEAFLSLPRFRELIGLVKQARKVFNEIAQREGGQFLQRKDVSAYRRTGTDDDGQEQGKFVSHALEQALKQIENAQPQHTACPWNHVDGPHPDPCPTCLGLNWTPALGGSIPPMAVERIKEKYGV